MKHILLVNPYIYDFAAYDFWMKPLGLLTISSLLKEYGFTVDLIDCLDRSEYYKELEYKTQPNNTGKFKKTEVMKPECLKIIDRRFYRYGIDIFDFEKKLKEIKPAPDAICVSCMMTYWYYGANETIKLLKQIFPNTPIIFGGIYNTLWPKHSKKNICADYFIEGPAEKSLVKLLSAIFDLSINTAVVEKYYTTDYSLYENLYSAAILTTRGCVFDCAYCASKKISENFVKYSIDDIIELLGYLINIRGVKDIAFYDDALLIDADNHFIPLMEKIIKKNFSVRFHLPNAAHIRYIDRRVAELMKIANFDTIRLGMETIDEKWHKETGGKLTYREYEACLNNFINAGFDLTKIKAYILTGLPNQSLDDIKKTVKIITNSGIGVDYAFFSPLPETKYWAESVNLIPEILNEPLLTNCSVYPVLINMFFDRRKKKTEYKKNVDKT